MNSNLKNIGKNIRDCIRDRVFWIWRCVLLEAHVDDFCKITPDIGIEYRFGDSSDIDRLNKEHHEYDDEARKFASERLQDGDKLILGFHSGDVVFYCWLMINKMDLHYRNYIPISSNRIYGYKAFTVKEYRSKYFSAGAFRLIAEFMKQMGYNKKILTVDIRNRPSIKSTSRIGYRPIGTIYKIRFLSNIRCIMSKSLRNRILNTKT